MANDEYQKCFIDCIEHHFSKNQFFGLPYKLFTQQFSESSFGLDSLYEMFCLGIDYGSKEIKRSDL